MKIKFKLNITDVCQGKSTKIMQVISEDDVFTLRIQKYQVISFTCFRRRYANACADWF